MEVCQLEQAIIALDDRDDLENCEEHKWCEIIFGKMVLKQILRRNKMEKKANKITEFSQFI